MTRLAVALLVGLAAWMGVRSPGRPYRSAGRAVTFPAQAEVGLRAPHGLAPHRGGGVRRRGLALWVGAATVGVIAWGGGVGVLSLVVAAGVAAAGVAALRVVASEMATGRTPREALAVAAREAAQAAVRSELTCAVAFGQWGGDEAALLVRARAGAPWLSQLGGCLTVCAQTGAGPVAVIEGLAHRADQGEQHRHEVAAALAGPRAQARILAALPVAGVLLGAALGGNPLRLVGTPLGTALLVAGWGLEIAGLAWMRRLTERSLALLP